MNNNVLIYVDMNTSRIARIVNQQPFLCPADISNWYCVTNQLDQLPTQAQDFKSPSIHLVRQHMVAGVPGSFSVETAQIDNDTLLRFQKQNAQAECLELLGLKVGGQRYYMSDKMFGSTTLINQYQQEVDQYDKTQKVGPLLSSLLNDNTNIDLVIAELKLKHEMYINFLTWTEVTFNNLSSKIKSATNPYLLLSNNNFTF